MSDTKKYGKDIHEDEDKGNYDDDDEDEDKGNYEDEDEKGNYEDEDKGNYEDEDKGNYEDEDEDEKGNYEDEDEGNYEDEDEKKLYDILVKNLQAGTLLQEDEKLTTSNFYPSNIEIIFETKEGESYMRKNTNLLFDNPRGKEIYRRFFRSILERENEDELFRDKFLAMHHRFFNEYDILQIIYSSLISYVYGGERRVFLHENYLSSLILGKDDKDDKYMDSNKREEKIHYTSDGKRVAGENLSLCVGNGKITLANALLHSPYFTKNRSLAIAMSIAEMKQTSQPNINGLKFLALVSDPVERKVLARETGFVIDGLLKEGEMLDLIHEKKLIVDPFYREIWDKEYNKRLDILVKMLGKDMAGMVMDNIGKKKMSPPK